MLFVLPYTLCLRLTATGHTHWQHKTRLKYGQCW